MHARCRAGVLGGLMVVSGCTAELTPEAMHEQIRAYFAAQGIEPRTIRCPGSLERTVGSTMVCEVQVDDEGLEVVVEVSSEQGPPTVRPRQDTLVTARIEPEIAQALRDQGRTVAQVRCGGSVWVIRPEQERRCAVVLADGERLTWIGTFTGEGSRHRARLVPAERGAMP